MGKYLTANRKLVEGEWDSLPKLMRGTWVKGWSGGQESMKDYLVEKGLLKEEEVNRENVLRIIREGKLVHTSQTS